MEANVDFIHKNLFSIITASLAVMGFIFALYKHFSETRYKMKISDFEQAVKYFSDDKHDELIQKPILGDLFCRTVTYFRYFGVSEINKLIQYQIGLDDLKHFERLKRGSFIEFNHSAKSYEITKKARYLKKDMNIQNYSLILGILFIMYVICITLGAYALGMMQYGIGFVLVLILIAVPEIKMFQMIDRKKSFIRYNEIIISNN